MLPECRCLTPRQHHSCAWSVQYDAHMQACVNASQLGQLVNLNPIDLLGDSIPDVGVPPLNVPNLLGVQFLGVCHVARLPHAACCEMIDVQHDMYTTWRNIVDVNGFAGFSVANFAVSNKNLSVSNMFPALCASLHQQCTPCL